MLADLDIKDISDYLALHEIDEPVLIRRQSMPYAVIIPYGIYQAMHSQNRKALRIDELADEDMKAIQKSYPPALHKQFNDELDD